MSRRFEYVNRIIEKDFKLPERSTAFSGGYDFYCIEDISLKAKEITLVKTGVKSKFPKNEILMLCNRSSNPKKKGIILINGVGIVDADYYGNEDNDGEIGFLFYNMTNNDVFFEKGDKIGQGIFIKYGIVDDDNAKGIRKSGFGSTGK